MGILHVIFIQCILNYFEVVSGTCIFIGSDLRHDQETQLAYRPEIAKIRL